MISGYLMMYVLVLNGVELPVIYVLDHPIVYVVGLAKLLHLMIYSLELQDVLALNLVMAVLAFLKVDHWFHQQLFLVVD